MRFAFALLLLAVIGSAQARDDGRYAQTDSKTREWFRSQKIPGGPIKGISCCDIADGVEAQEEIRGDDYWVSYKTREGVESGWQKVDRDTQLIKEPNAFGHTVVWYYYENAKPRIRCFIPGAGI
ncbi:MAG: hypothetical protein IT537_03100 [Hyphomicrobiales bacterium]|nr:hypothetical protein [Hyphomicrobiales bacterium]